jgi:hypothetical protein
MAIRVCPLCQAEFLEFKTVCSHCNVALLDPEADVDPRSLDADDQVVYELGGWPLDAQGDAAQALAESGIPHIWDGTDVVMPLTHEAAADVLLERIEREYGLHADDENADDDDEPGDGSGETEYDVTAWPTPRRIELVEKLVELSVPHRWEGDLLLVPTHLEDTVDDVLDEMEGGSLANLNDEVDEGDGMEPAEALSTLFLAGERMRKGKVDVDVYGSLLAVLEGSDEEVPPYGFEPKIWEKALELGEDLADAVAEDTDEIEQLADELYHLLRPYV